MPPPEAPSPGALAGAAGAGSEAAYCDADAPQRKPSASDNPHSLAASWLRCRSSLPLRSRPKLCRDDLEALRRLTAQACHVVYLPNDAAGGKETRRAAYRLADELASRHGRAEPRLSGRELGTRP